MSKQNRRSGKSFSTLGQRMLSFGRGIMRTYASETPVQADTTSSEPIRQQGQWRSMTNKNLIWRQEQPISPPTPPPAPTSDADFDYADSDYANYDDMGQPIQRQQQPRPQQPIQRQQQPRPQQPAQPSKPTPSYIKSADGTPVKVSRKQFPNDLQRRLESIAAAHEEVAKEREQKRDKKVESIQRKVDSGEVAPYRRRGSIEVDYVQTESLLPADERGKPPKPIQTQRQDSPSTDSSDATTDSPVDTDDSDESQWFDEIPDDDANIDNMAGFESSEEDIQRLPDDLPRFDESSLSEEDPPNDMGEFEGGSDSFLSQSANPNTEINREFDDYSEQSSSDVDDSSLDIPPPISESPVQRTPQDFLTLPEFDDGDSEETVPLVPNYDSPASQPTPSTDAPSIQRSEADDANNDMGNLSESSSVENTSVQRNYSDEPSFDEGFDSNESDFNPTPSIDPTPSNESPVQRQTIQRDSFDESFDDSDTDFSQPPSESPVQGQAIQRDSFDAPSFDESFDDNDTDFSQGTPESPVQGQAIQRDSLDAPSFDESFDDSDSDFSQGTPESPVQGQAIQRDSFDAPSFDESFDDNDTDFSQPPPELPVQGQAIQRDSLDEPTMDEDFQNSDNPYSPLDQQVSDAPNQQPNLQREASENTPIQRTEFEHPDLGDGGDYNDYGNETWAEQNDYSPIADTPSDNPSIQRDAFDDFDNSDVANFDSDPSVDNVDMDSAPVQREMIQRSDLDAPIFDDHDDFLVDNFGESNFEGGDSQDFQSTNDTSRVQRQQSDPMRQSEMDGLSFDDIGDIESVNSQSPSQDNSVQRSEDESPDTESRQDSSVQRQQSDAMRQSEMDGRSFDEIGDIESINFQSPSQDVPVQRSEGESPDTESRQDSSVQRQQSDAMRQSEMDGRSFDEIGDIESINFQSPSQDAPVQRWNDTALQDNENDDLSNEYANFGDETWAEQNNYSPATDSDPSPQTSIQRDIDDSESSLPQIDNGFDHLEDTDGITAMNILDDYLTERHSPSDSDSSNGESGPVQRAYQDETYDYLPDGFDPTPTFYDFNQAQDNISSPPTHDMPIQRSSDEDKASNEQPIDLFQALSQAGMIDAPPSQSTPSQASVQRDYEADADAEYGDYGNATWAEANNYTPMPDPVTASNTPIQRTPQHDLGDDEQPMDLFQALSQAGMVKTPSSSSSAQSQTPVQRTSSQADENGGGLDSETVDLYNAMMQSGMIQDSSKTPDSTSSHSQPVQRSPQESQSSGRSMMDMLSRASQVSDSTGANSSNSGDSNPVNAGIDGIARQILQRQPTPVSASDMGVSPETERQNTDQDVESDDKEYLGQIARDVFRIIKRRLREEKERRG